MFPIYINDGKSPLPTEKEDIYYLIAKDGIYIRKKIGIMDSFVKVKNISFLKKVEPYVKLNIKKIPASLFAKIVSLFRAVYDKYNSEAEVNLFYNEKTQQYQFLVPKQEVTATSVNYERKNPFQDWIMLGTVHSHASMPAFHSSIDTSDEGTFDGLHITIGKLNEKNKFDIVASAVSNGTRIKVDPHLYIDGLVTIEEEEEDIQHLQTYFVWENNKLVVKQKDDKIKKKLKKWYTLDVKPECYEFEKSLLDNITPKIQPAITYYGEWFRNLNLYRNGSYINEEKHFCPSPSVFRPPKDVKIAEFPDRSRFEDLEEKEIESKDQKSIDNSHPCFKCIHRDEKLDWLLNNMLLIEEDQEEEINQICAHESIVEEEDEEDYEESEFHPCEGCLYEQEKVEWFLENVDLITSPSDEQLDELNDNYEFVNDYLARRQNEILRIGKIINNSRDYRV